jgi:hypothetical protein
MDDIYTQTIRLRNLRALIERGVFAVPELQREFVWNARKACQLLDSIYRNYPIGTILVWKTSRRNEGQLRSKFHILPPFNRGNRDVYFLIDGQQRLSVLWHFLRGEPTSVVNADKKEVNFGNIYFDPYCVDGASPFLYRSRVASDLSDRLIAVVDLLSRRWRYCSKHHGIRAIKRIEACRRAIHHYETFIEYCETNDLTEVRETFIRINSLGMRIGAADKAFARASKFNLRALVRDAQVRLKHGFDEVNRTSILQAIALAFGIRDLGERGIDAMISRIERKESERARFDRLWPALRDAFGAAADYFVYDLGVANFDFLPSEPMLVILTLFFFHHGSVRPSRAVKKRLQQWFWATAVGARYTGRGYRTNLLADAAFMEKLASHPKAHGALNVKLPIYTLIRTEYGRPGPVSNAFFCLLRSRGPRYLEDASKIPLGEISSRRNRNDKHHIFPRALLSRYRIGPERFNSIANICYLVARENQSVGQRAPRSYFQDIPRSARVRKAVLKSHLIPFHEGRGILDHSIKRGFKTFLNDRSWVLARAFESQCGMKLFERS